MFENHTEDYTRVLEYARAEASMRGSECIGTEHLLLGIATAVGSCGLDVLKEQGINYDSLSKEIGWKKDEPDMSVDIPLSRDTYGVIKLARASAERRHHVKVSTLHLLEGMLDRPRSAGVAILNKRAFQRELLEKALNYKEQT